MFKSLVPYSVLFITLAIFSTVQAPVSAARRPRRYYSFTVYIINGCQSSGLPITGSCSSYSRRAGNFALTTPWEDFHWSITVNYTREVVYSCGLEMGTSYERSIIAFDLNRDYSSSRCGLNGECYWKANETAIYFGNDNHIWSRAYNWTLKGYNDKGHNVIQPTHELPLSSLS